MEHGLIFDAINDNLPEIIELYGNNSIKITCDIYIDDRNMKPEELIGTGLLLETSPFNLCLI